MYIPFTFTLTLLWHCLQCLYMHIVALYNVGNRDNDLTTFFQNKNVLDVIYKIGMFFFSLTIITIWQCRVLPQPCKTNWLVYEIGLFSITLFLFILCTQHLCSIDQIQKADSISKNFYSYSHFRMKYLGKLYGLTYFYLPAHILATWILSISSIFSTKVLTM